jgi:Arc/MetJ-type ribon-helix-helix transcriptional regulator
MVAAPSEDFEPEPAQPLSALEEALRRALEAYSREQVLNRVVRALPADRAPADSTPEPGLHGKVEKVSVSLPRELTEAIRARTGAGGFSRYVAEAVQKQLQHDLLSDLLDELQAEHGRVPEEIREQTRQLWPDTAH